VDHTNEPTPSSLSIFAPTIQVLKNPILRRAVLSFAIGASGLGFLSSASALTIKYVYAIKEAIVFLGVPLSVSTQNMVLQILPILVGLVILPLALYLLPRLGISTLWWHAATGMAVVTAYFMAIEPQFYLIVIGLIGLGLVLSVFMLLPDVMLAHVMAQEIEDKPKDFPGAGAVLGTAALLTNLMNVSVGAAQSAILSFCGYIQPSDDIPYPVQTNQTKIGIQVLGLVFPLVYLLLAYSLLPTIKPRPTKVPNKKE